MDNNPASQQGVWVCHIQRNPPVGDGLRAIQWKKRGDLHIQNFIGPRQERSDTAILDKDLPEREENTEKNTNILCKAIQRTKIKVSVSFGCFRERPYFYRFSIGSYLVSVSFGCFDSKG